MIHSHQQFSQRILDATKAIFGESAITRGIQDCCERHAADLENVFSARGVQALLLAIVGAKGQGKTWVARQLIRNEAIRNQLRSGDLAADATTRLVWIGQTAPEGLNPNIESFHPCSSADMVELGQPYILLDMPGLSDANHEAAQIANEALSLAPIKLLVVARDQLRAATGLTIAKQIDGAACIVVVTSVEPEELDASSSGVRASGQLASDLRNLRDQLSLSAPHSTFSPEVLVADFEITGDEQAAGESLVTQLLDRLSEIGLEQLSSVSSRETRAEAIDRRLRGDVAKLIGAELPHLADAVGQLNRETEQLPERVLTSLLGNESVLETGVRMRLRARLGSDTSLIWFPYRTVLSTLNLTQGAWDRVMLTLAGSVPSLFGALASWAKNVRQSREFGNQIQDGIRQRTQQQVEERLQPLCDEFHRTVMKMRPREERESVVAGSTGMQLTGIEELQTSSQEIFDQAIHRNATRNWLTQTYALIGVAIFWFFMSAPILLIYRDYFMASLDVLRGGDMTLDRFPHPTTGLLVTSLILSLLPLALYCMLVLTLSLSRRKVRRIAKQIVFEHEAAIAELKQQNVIRLQFDDELVHQAEFLLNFRQS